MKLKRFCDEKGITLIELLVTLTISTLVIGIVWGVLSASLDQNNKAQAHNLVRQEANIVITQIRQLHEKDDYDLCYGNDQMLYIDSAKTNPLATNNYKFLNVSINDESLTNTNPCRRIITSSPLRISLTLVDNQNNKFDLHTIIEELGDYKP